MPASSDARYPRSSCRPPRLGSSASWHSLESSRWLRLYLFYSPAMHMRQSLGAWPTSIGVRGFSGALIVHCSIATNCFSVFLLVSILAWPVIFLLCSLIRRWRICVYYLGVHALACLVCIGTMHLAPARFLRWWWD